MPNTEPGPSGIVQVRLPAGFTHSHQQAVHRYLRGQESLSGDDWLSLIQAMDMLRRAEIVQEGRVETFAALYDRLVDAVYSARLIEQLLRLDSPESECEPLRAAIVRRILADLRVAGWWRAAMPESQWLVAFCLYWWQMFVRGYAFEIAIYRDLADSGVVHTAHNLRDHRARLSGHDLEIMGFRGDVKTSTYFVLTRRRETLPHDFYVTRMYHANTRRWHRVVWLKPAFWRVLDGEPTVVDYGAIWQVWPGTAQIVLRGRQFVVLPYEEWKQRMLARQAEEANQCLTTD